MNKNKMSDELKKLRGELQLKLDQAKNADYWEGVQSLPIFSVGEITAYQFSLDRINKILGDKNDK